MYSHTYLPLHCMTKSGFDLLQGVYDLRAEMVAQHHHSVVQRDRIANRRVASFVIA